jgi:hypothetical protein
MTVPIRLFSRLLAVIVAGLAGWVPTAFGQNTYTGTGIRLSLATDAQRHPKIETVYPGSPAAREGVQPGDVVIAVDGKVTDTTEFGDIVRQLGGEPGQRHRIELGNPGRTVELPVELVKGRCVTGDCENGTGLWEDVLGDLYSGQFRNGRYHGQGRLEQGTNYVYEGGFQDGEFHGRGTLNDHGQIFAGNWAGGREADGPGFRTFPNGSRLEGEGSWVNGFTGKGTFIDSVRQLRAEGRFDGASNLERLTGQASVRSLATGHIYRGRFEHGDLVGSGEIEPREGARFPVRFKYFTELYEALAKTNAADIAHRVPTRSLGIERDPEPAATAAAPRPAKPGTATAAAPKLVACPSCRGTGYEIRSCGWCAGKGSVERSVATYKRKETPYVALSVYDSAGKFIGNASGRDVSYEAIKNVRQERCQQCEGAGARTTNQRCPTCRGQGTVAER